MRRLLILLVLLITTVGVAQKLPKIKGSGIVEINEVPLVEPFSKIVIDGDMEVELIQGSENGYSIETDDNLMEVVQFGVADSTLTVSMTHRITRKKKFNVIIKITDLKHIQLDNGGQIESNKKLKGDAITLVAGKSSKFDLDFEFTNSIKVMLSLDASGTIESAANKVQYQLNDRASLKTISTSDTLTVNVTNSSKLNLNGSAVTAQINVKDTGKFLAKDASLTNVEINLKDKAEGVVNAKDTITLYAKDTSTLQLYGDAEITVSGLKNKAKILKKE